MAIMMNKLPKIGIMHHPITGTTTFFRSSLSRRFRSTRRLPVNITISDDFLSYPSKKVVLKSMYSFLTPPGKALTISETDGAIVLSVTGIHRLLLPSLVSLSIFFVSGGRAEKALHVLKDIIYFLLAQLVPMTNERYRSTITLLTLCGECNFRSLKVVLSIFNVRRVKQLLFISFL